MAKKLYVGGISYSTNDNGLRDAFAQVGPVTSAVIIMDKMTGRSKGFGFVEMTNDADADAAIAKWNGQELDGRKLTVNEARPMEPRAPREGGRGGFGGGNDRGGRTW
jgi:cold-inducible RNA-binding protein